MNATAHELSPQIRGIATASEFALDYALDRHPGLDDELSVEKIEVDGQYVTVTVLVSNTDRFTAKFDISDPTNVRDAD